MDRRIHFLDQVRSHMMLLGIVLHAAGSYNNLPAGELWPYKSTEVHVLYSVLINLIHSFRMQVFFIVAGLFAAMLLTKRGNVGFLKNRTQRVLLPLLVFAAPIIVCCDALYAYGAQLMALRGVQIDFSSGISLYHLWFLYYLYCYVLAAIPLQWLLRKVVKEGHQGYVAKGLPWVLGLAVALVHLIKGSYVLAAPLGLDLKNEVFLQYFLYFAAGMTAYHVRDAFFARIERWGRLLSLTVTFVVLFIASVALNAAQNQNDPNGLVWYGALFLGLYYAFVCWFVLAIYKRLCDRFSRLSRYLSEASYWVYLVHLPMTVALPMLINEWPVHHSVKFGLVLLVTSIVSVLTYHLLVRSTPIGWLLNGKRRPFSFLFINRSTKFKAAEQAA